MLNVNLVLSITRNAHRGWKEVIAGHRPAVFPSVGSTGGEAAGQAAQTPSVESAVTCDSRSAFLML